MARYTKKQALRDCAVIWGWLAKSGSSNKPNIPAEVIDIGQFTLWCPCCEYALGDGEHLKCNKCPLKGLWGSEVHGMPDQNAKGEFYYCEGSDSPYHLWIYSGTVDERKKYAKVIADECNRLLKA